MKKLKLFKNFINESVPFYDSEELELNKDLLKVIKWGKRDGGGSTSDGIYYAKFKDGKIIIGEIDNSFEFSMMSIRGTNILTGEYGYGTIDGHGAKKLIELRKATQEEIDVLKYNV